jgi:hypothetical protein
MKKVEFKQDGTIEVDGVIYEKQQQAEPPKVTLSDVFVKNDSRWLVGTYNRIIKSDIPQDGKVDCNNQLPIERDAKRVQAFIALINCARYFNGDWHGRGGYWVIWDNCIGHFNGGNERANEVRFSTEHGATETVRILKEAGLYEYLFLEIK